MIGPVCPNPPPVPPRRVDGAWLCALVRLVSAALILCASPAAGEDINLRLRIAFGGGVSRQWQGEISLHSGAFVDESGAVSDVRPLGLEGDEAGAAVLQRGPQGAPSVLRISQRSARSYDGVDVSVSGPADAVLSIQLSAGSTEGRVSQTTLGELARAAHVQPLDDGGNRVVVRRAPGDTLRLIHERDSLVFAPGETWDVEVRPHFVGAESSTAATLAASLEKLNGDPHWSQSTPIRSNPAGEFDRGAPLHVKLPEQEGVYALTLAIQPRRRSLVTTPFVRSQPLARRVVQLVVVNDQPRTPPENTSKFEQILDIDPVHPKIWERLVVVPQLKFITGWGASSWGNDLSSVEKIGQREHVALAPGGWQAYPLPVEKTGVPHVLVVEHPTDAPQTLGISVVEPNAAGALAPIGLDSGVDVSAEGEPGAMGAHRLIFWPKTKAPLVVLTNRRENSPARFTRLRVLAGPAQLPSEPAVEEGRLLATWFDKPLFPETFGAGEALDAASGRTLDDWHTFYLGGSRLAGYLQHAGYNAAVVPAICEGAALYPSQVVQSIPKYDTGTFFVNGHDPMQKDVLEMLFRMFDSRKLKLMVSVQFSFPLPELESLARRGGADAVGLRWIDARGVDARQEAPGCWYNPLDRRVQRGMTRVIEELADRYGRHPSFAGIAIQLGPQTYAQLPGLPGSYDDRTMARFSHEQQIDVPGEGRGRFADRAAFLQKQNREAWRQWRATQVADLHRQMQEAIERVRPDAKLVLAPTELFKFAAMQQSLRPALSPAGDVRDGLIEIGLIPGAYEEHSGITLLRPRRIAPIEGIAQARHAWPANRSEPLDTLFQEAADTGHLHFHETLKLALPSFDDANPLGVKDRRTLLYATVSPSGEENRRRFVQSLAASDVSLVCDGGWMPAMGQEQSLTPLFQVYRGLPPASFKTASAPQPADAQPVIVRTLSEQSGDWVWLINNSPWPVNVELEMSASGPRRLESLSGRVRRGLERRGANWVWRLSLEPWDMEAARLVNTTISVKGWSSELSPQIISRLQNRVADLQSSVQTLGQRTTMPELKNANFDEPENEQEGPPGWIFAKGTDIEVRLDDRQPHTGAQSLYLRSEGPVIWARSDPLPAPKTGRLTMVVWLRAIDPTRQPPLMLAFEYVHQGRRIYKPAAVGAQGKPLESQWTPYLWQIDDLPAGDVTDLRIGFDLMGQGEVWIDNIQLYDLWFHRPEQAELEKLAALAKFHLVEGREADCQKVLSSYWSRYLLENVTPPATPDPATPVTASEPEAPAREARNRSFLERFWPSNFFKFDTFRR